MSAGSRDVLNSSQGEDHRASRKFQHRRGPRPDRRHPPGLQAFFNVNDDPFAVKVEHIDGEPHGQRVNAVAGKNPESLSGTETGGVGGHESAKAGPVGARDDQFGREVGRPCSVESVSCGPVGGHENSWRDL